MGLQPPRICRVPHLPRPSSLQPRCPSQITTPVSPCGQGACAAAYIVASSNLSRGQQMSANKTVVIPPHIAQGHGMYGLITLFTSALLLFGCSSENHPACQAGRAIITVHSVAFSVDPSRVRTQDGRSLSCNEVLDGFDYRMADEGSSSDYISIEKTQSDMSLRAISRRSGYAIPPSGGSSVKTSIPESQAGFLPLTIESGLYDRSSHHGLYNCNYFAKGVTCGITDVIEGHQGAVQTSMTIRLASTLRAHDEAISTAIDRINLILSKDETR